MKIAIVTRENAESFYGGDLKALSLIRDGFKELNHEASLVSNVASIQDEDLVFLSNTTLDLSSKRHFLSIFKNKKYALIPFHEDFLKYEIPALGLLNYLKNNLLSIKEPGLDYSVERLIENPSLIYYFPIQVRKDVFFNYDVIKDATINIANSKMEKKTILRDCPQANASVVYLTSGCEECSHRENDDFLKLSNLKKGEYLLQVGRLQLRKNQLATILATKDLDIPLVFISSRGFVSTLITDLILKYRKAKTIIISQDLPRRKEKHLEIIPMPKNKILSNNLLYSAFKNAGLLVHPAFYELPGYTYLEAVKYGIPTIASNWSSIKEYFSDPKTNRYLLDDRVEYVEPYDIDGIKKLILKKFGKKYPENPDMWIYKRTKKDVAKEILDLIV
jgi:glycosyltransferase involved in cell wall biosynthesis